MDWKQGTEQPLDPHETKKNQIKIMDTKTAIAHLLGLILFNAILHANEGKSYRIH